MVKSFIVTKYSHLPYAIENQFKAPKAPNSGISCLSLVLYGIWIGGFNAGKGWVLYSLAISLLSFSVGAENGRLGTERGGGAWCPASLVRENSSEWLQVSRLKYF